MTRRRLTRKEKRGIVVLHKIEEWKGIELARLFGCSAGRISQILSNYYDEQERLGFYVESSQE